MSKLTMTFYGRKTPYLLNVLNRTILAKLLLGVTKTILKFNNSLEGLPEFNVNCYNHSCNLLWEEDTY